MVSTPQDGGLGIALTSSELQKSQTDDEVLAQVQSWEKVGWWPEWAKVSMLGPELKAYHYQWGNTEFQGELMYRWWQAPSWGGDILQLLVPCALHSQVLQLVHGLVGTGHFGIAKTLHLLRVRFYWPGCRRDMELHVHCCDVCTVQKRPSHRFQAPLQQYLLGAPME